MADFTGTSLGLEFEFPKLRIVNGGEPKTVLFSTGDSSDMPGEKLVKVTVDIATGGSATTEVITGPIVANLDNPKWTTMFQYFSNWHKAVEDSIAEGKLATKDRVLAKMEGRELEEEEEDTKDLEQEVAEVAKEVPKDASTSASTVGCPNAPPPPPPPPPPAKKKPEVKKEKVPEEDQPRFESSDRGWFNSTPQVNLGIQIATVGDARFKTYGLMRNNLGGRLGDVYPHIVSHLDAYLAPILDGGTDAGRKLELKGALCLYAMITGLMAAMNKNNLDTLDNKKVPYKEGWGILPKVMPVLLWEKINGDELLPRFWNAVKTNKVYPDGAEHQVGEAERFVDTLFPADDRRRDDRLSLLKQLATKTTSFSASAKKWKPAPGAPPPFMVAGKPAMLWEMRLSASDTRKATAAHPENPTFGIFENESTARTFFKLCADLAEAHKDIPAAASSSAPPPPTQSSGDTPPPPPPPPKPPPPPPAK